MDRLPDFLENVARVRVKVAGVLTGTRREIDFTSPNGTVTWAATDDGTNEKVTLTGDLAYPLGAANSGTLPSGALAQAFDRNLWAPADSAQLLSGRLSLYGVSLAKGQVLTSITFRSGTTPLAVGTNQWFGVFTSARAIGRLTGDDTSTAWAANTMKTLTLSSTYTVPATGLYYIGICVVASTVPTLFGISGNTSLAGVTPVLRGSSSTGLTNPASCPDPVTAPSATGVQPYFYVS